MADPIRQATQLELAYIAGIIDGEGTIFFHIDKGYARYEQSKGKKKWLNPDAVRYRYKVAVKMIDSEPVRLCHEVFGGWMGMEKTKRDGHRFPRFKWEVSERRAAGCVRQILPFLLIKRKQAQILLDFSDLVSKHWRRGRYHRVPEAEKAVREAMVAQGRSLNQRDHLQRLQ